MPTAFEQRLKDKSKRMILNLDASSQEELYSEIAKMEEHGFKLWRVKEYQTEFFGGIKAVLIRGMSEKDEDACLFCGKEVLQNGVFLTPLKPTGESTRICFSCLDVFNFLQARFWEKKNKIKKQKKEVKK
ncbi:MAG: hypothetical protein V1494_01150 [Candidatus Diapherotrites archaeon]